MSWRALHVVRTWVLRSRKKSRGMLYFVRRTFLSKRLNLDGNVTVFLSNGSKLSASHVCSSWMVMERNSVSRYRIYLTCSSLPCSASRYLSAHTYLSEEPVVFLLDVPSVVILEVANESLRQRLSALPIADHARVAPYTTQSHYV
jgi:hypothetical protein